MFFNILKKDLKRKKNMNFILLIFIILCTTFLASSLNYMATTPKALDYFEEKTNAADYYLLTFEKNQIEDWIKTNELVKDYENKEFLIFNANQFTIPSKKEFSTNGTICVEKFSKEKKFSRILDIKNNPIKEIKSGEIALSNDCAKNNNLKVGDLITVKMGDKIKNLKFTTPVKDIAFGTSFIGISKITISEEDYNFFKDAEDTLVGSSFLIKTSDVDKFEKSVNSQTFNAFADFSKDTVRYCYKFDMMVASIMFVISICLILIAIIVLRFSIGFTIQEDFREIGIMKAIGLHNSGIKKLYIVKYFAISIIGSIIGVLLSFPFGNMLMKNIQDNIAIQSTKGNFYINLICGVSVVIIVIIFCYISASKVNKFTAIQAIRNGSSGERFNQKSHFKLNKRRKMSTLFYMALNDIFSSVKSFSILVIIFIIGTLMVIMPINAVNTLASDSCLELFGLLKHDFYINNNKADMYCYKGDEEYIKNDVKVMKQLYHDNGIDVDIYKEYLFSVRTDPKKDNNSISFLGLHCPDLNANKFPYTRGFAPQLENEIAMSEVTIKKLKVDIGDTISISVGEEEKEYIIVGSFEWMMNKGEGIRFSQNVNINMSNLVGIMNFGCDFKDRTDIQSQINKIKELSPDYEIYNSSEYLDLYLGSITSRMEKLKLLLTVVVLFINCLITILMTKTLMTKDISSISLLKNIGFKDRSIKIWQALRIIIVLAVSILVGGLLSNPLNVVMTKYTFGAMGASNIKLNIIPFEVYFLYPLILFIGTTITALISTNAINRINLMQVNNME